MATNEVFREADSLSLPVPTGTLSGTPLRIGAINAIAQTDEGSVVRAPIPGGPQLSIPSGGVGNRPGFASVRLSGGWKVNVLGAVTVGEVVYIEPDNLTLTTTSTGNFPWGVALQANAVTTVKPVIVKIVNTGSAVAAA
jgi:hypothetical protein